MIIREVKLQEQIKVRLLMAISALLISASIVQAQWASPENRANDNKQLDLKKIEQKLDLMEKRKQKRNENCVTTRTSQHLSHKSESQRYFGKDCMNLLDPEPMVERERK